MGADAVIHLPGQGRELPLAGHPLRVLLTGEASRHACVFDWTVPPRFATGLHVHNVQEETFFVLDGTAEWQVGDRVVTAGPGSWLFLPPGVPHDIRNPGEAPIRLLMTVSPPGHEHYFEELSELTAGGKPDPAAIGALRARYDTTQLSALRTEVPG